MKGKSNNPTIQMIYLMIIDSEENKRKFVVLYEKYRYLLMKVAYDVLGDNYLAEDAVHEAFIKVTKNMEKIGDVNSQETKRYLITITKNSAIDIYRKKCIQMKREVFVDELDEEEMPFACMETDTDNSVLDILKNLPANYSGTAWHFGGKRKEKAFQRKGNDPEITQQSGGQSQWNT